MTMPPDLDRGQLEKLDQGSLIELILAMQQLGDRRAVNVLVEHLNGCGSTSLCLCILQALSKLGDGRAIPAVRDCLKHPNQHVREWANITLTQLEVKLAA